MKLQFQGAAGTVTGSRYLLQSDEKQILVDCGLFQGLKNLRLLNRRPFSFNPQRLNGVILTHAHLDHSGLLPLLVKHGFCNKIYCTPATKDLCHILLRDSAHLQQEDADFANRHGFSKHKPALPLYTIEDVEKTLPLLEAVLFKQETTIGASLRFTFFPVGHILGAASVYLSDSTTSITFSGDVGRLDDPLMYEPEVPEIGDYLVIESTYGDRKHPEEDPKTRIAELVKTTLAHQGTVIIPSFALGRTQTLCYLFYQLLKANQIPRVPIYVNSPMACSVTQLYDNYNELHKASSDEIKEMNELIQLCTSVEDSKRIDQDPKPKVIISASGMATGGRVIHHIKTYGPDPKSLILFAGYQAAGTRGEAMVNGAEAVKIHGQYIPIKAQIADLDTLSAHGDYDEILTWLRRFKQQPKFTFITHGEASASEAFRRQLAEHMKWPAHAPLIHEAFELTKGEAIPTTLS